MWRLQPITAGLLYAGISVNLVCGSSTKHLSWRTKTSPKIRTAQARKTLATTLSLRGQVRGNLILSATKKPKPHQDNFSNSFYTFALK